jgi:hypothetical protein
MDRPIQDQSHLGAREVSRCLMGDYHNVRPNRQSLARMAKPLSNTAFYSIANHRVTHPLADRNSQPSSLLVGVSGCILGSRCDYDDKTLRNSTFSGLERSPEVSSAQNPIRLLKASGFPKHGFTSTKYLQPGAFGPWCGVA